MSKSKWKMKDESKILHSNRNDQDNNDDHIDKCERHDKFYKIQE